MSFAGCRILQRQVRAEFGVVLLRVLPCPKFSDSDPKSFSAELAQGFFIRFLH